jgi:type IV pilus assembly protein PilX
MKHHANTRQQQTGAALVVSLMILLVMTLVGVSSLQTTALEERMASNTREREQAFEAAEAALRGAEEFIEDTVAITSPFDTDGSDGLYGDTVHDMWRTLAWNASDSREFANFQTTYDTGSSYKPRYIIEHYGTTGANEYNMDNYGEGSGEAETELFRITVRGVGANNKSPVYLQSAYGKDL